MFIKKNYDKISIERMKSEVDFYWYPNCSTCKKAKIWLDQNEIDYTAIHIVDNPPSEEELAGMVEKSNLPIQRFFNTSGKKYRELNLKERVKRAEEKELIELLASDGMLIKRPLAFDGAEVTVGFKPEQYEKSWK